MTGPFTCHDVIWPDVSSKFFTSATFDREGGYFNMWLNGHLLYLREQNDSTDIRGGRGCRIHVNR
jgi:hypothetical protein